MKWRCHFPGLVDDGIFIRRMPRSYCDGIEGGGKSTLAHCRGDSCTSRVKLIRAVADINQLLFHPGNRRRRTRR